MSDKVMKYLLSDEEVKEIYQEACTKDYKVADQIQRLFVEETEK